MMKNTFVFLFVIITLYFGLNEAAGCHKNTVAFRNNLSSSHSILKIHCRSKDDDLGDHLVNFESSAYNFSFHDSIFRPTYFECNLWKGNNMEYHQSFRAYDAGLLIHCGKLFTWDAKDGAIYLSKDDEPEELKYYWILDKSS